MKPLISVLIPTYNCAQYIREAIDSVLAQDYDNLEIIVVDDGSNDNTKEIVMAYCRGVACNASTCNASTVKYFYKENGGISSARNACLEHASGEYIAWCDSDDYWLQGKLRAQMEYFEEHPDCQVVFTRYENFFENEELANDPKCRKEVAWAIFSQYHLTTSLAKRELFDNYGCFLDNLVIGEDTEIGYRWQMFNLNVEHYIKDVYYRRRLHATNISLSHDDAITTATNDIIHASLVEYSAKSGISVDVVEKKMIGHRWTAQQLRGNIQRGNIKKTTN
jgi:glycosyltransferase involved in cell wall biosynthesis